MRPPSIARLLPAGLVLMLSVEGPAPQAEATFAGPASVRSHPDGRRFVVDDLAHRVVVLDPPTPPRILGGYGSAHGQLLYPDAVHWWRDGSLVIADTGGNRMQVWTRDGRFVFEFGRPSWLIRAARRVLGASAFSSLAPVQLTNPRDVWVGPDDAAYVADTGADVVRVFDRAGTLVGIVGRPGTGPGELRRPLGVTVDRAGRLLVSDSGNHRVQIFTADGRFIASIGRPGSDRGQLDSPHGIAVDESGRIVVSDRGNGRVQVFEPDGRPVLVLDRAPDGTRFAPAGLSLTSEGDLLVADTAGHRVIEWPRAQLHAGEGDAHRP